MGSPHMNAIFQAHSEYKADPFDDERRRFAIEWVDKAIQKL